MSTQYYSIVQTALKVGLSQLTIRRAIKAGKLKAVLAANKYRITEEAINAYLIAVQPKEKAVAA